MRNANGTGPYRAQELRVRRPTRAGRQSALVGPARQRRRGDLRRHPVRRDAAGRARLGPGRLRHRSAVPGRRRGCKQEGRFKLAADRPTSARSISASTRAATSCSSATSRAAIRSRTCACGARSTRRSTSTRSSPRCCADRRRATGSYVSRLRRRLRAGSRRRLPYDPAAARALLEGSGLSGRLLGDARLRQRRVPRRRVPGDRRHARAGRHPDDVPAVADGDVLSQAHAGDDELFRVRLVAGDRRLADAECDRAQLRRRRRRHLQRRPLFESASSIS